MVEILVKIFSHHNTEHNQAGIGRQDRIGNGVQAYKILDQGVSLRNVCEGN